MNTINKYNPVRFPKNNERQFSETNNLNEKVQGAHTVQSSTQEDKILDGDKSNLQVTPSLNIAEFPTDKLLKMLTALLTKIIKSNDRTAATNPSLTHTQCNTEGTHNQGSSTRDTDRQTFPVIPIINIVSTEGTPVDKML